MFLNTLLSELTWYPTLFDSPLNAVRSVAIWLTLALVIAYTVCLFALKSDKRKRFLTLSAPILIAYACVLCALFLILSFCEDGIQPILFIPLLTLLCTIAGSAVVLLFKRSKGVYILLAITVGCAFVASLICMGVHFASGNAAEINWLANEDVQSVWLYVTSGLSVLVLLAIALFFGKGDKRSFDSKSITYAAICIAMSFALSFMRIVRLPQGGSITPASLLPLMVYAYMFGVKKGVFAGFVYGVLQAFQDPAVLHPAQFLLDYPVAFAWIGLAGLFSQIKTLDKYPQLQFAIGGITAGLGRFMMHFLSGTFAFGVFAPEGTPAALYSFLYQAGYVLPDLAIAVAVGIALFSSKAFVKETRKFHTPLKKEV
ncbi:MAG: energy-coupled thiamine transporter ThiT [Clostridia bacterium]|nr:energy-coupled thiamine transporter ThiT [Clostridia bacterium]